MQTAPPTFTVEMEGICVGRHTINTIMEISRGICTTGATTAREFTTDNNPLYTRVEPDIILKYLGSPTGYVYAFVIQESMMDTPPLRTNFLEYMAFFGLSMQYM
jgi:hypothetical protein